MFHYFTEAARRLRSHPNPQLSGSHYFDPAIVGPWAKAELRKNTYGIDVRDLVFQENGRGYVEITPFRLAPDETLQPDLMQRGRSDFHWGIIAPQTPSRGLVTAIRFIFQDGRSQLQYYALLGDGHLVMVQYDERTRSPSARSEYAPGREFFADWQRRGESMRQALVHAARSRVQVDPAGFLHRFGMAERNLGSIDMSPFQGVQL